MAGLFTTRPRFTTVSDYPQGSEAPIERWGTGIPTSAESAKRGRKIKEIPDSRN